MPIVEPPQLSVYTRAAIVTPDGQGSWGPLVEAAMLRPAGMRWGINGQPSVLTLERCLGRGPGQAQAVGAAEAAGWPAAGDEIRLVDESEQVWFLGHVAQQSVLIQAMPDAERLTFIAYGPELRLAHQSVHGQWSKLPVADDMELAGNLSPAQAVRANTFLADLATIFNAEGRANASQSVDLLDQDVSWLLTSRTGLAGVPGLAGYGCRVFEPPGRKVQGSGGPELTAQYWTAYTALRSLVEYVDDYTVVSPRTDWSAIKALLEGVLLSEVVVETLSLVEAIRAVLVPAGFGFCLSPWPDGVTDADGRLRHELHVFSLHPTSEVGTPPVLADPAEAPRMDEPAGQAAQVQRLELLRDAHGIANEVRVIGDRRRVQVCLNFDHNAGSRDLHPAWDTATHNLGDWDIENIIPEMESADYGGSPDPQVFIGRYGRGGGDYLPNMDVFRTFVWNEDGAYRPLLSTLPDLSGRLGTGAYARRPRALGPTLLHPMGASAAGALPAYVQIGIVGDDDAWILLPEARVLRDRAGFTVSAGRLDRFYPYRQAAASLRELYDAGPGRFSFATLLYNTLRGATGATEYKLRFRLVGTIAADDGVRGQALYNQASAWPLRASRTLYMPQRFGKTQLSSGSNPDGLPATVFDKTSAAETYAETVLAASLDAMGHGSIVLRHLTRAYRPGMAFLRTGGRAVDLAVGGGPVPAMAGVVGVRWVFEGEANKTELLLDSSLVETTK